MSTKESAKYFEAVGRRKTSVARVRLFESTKNTFHINDKDLASYFQTEELQAIAHAALKNCGTHKFKVSAKMEGGGIHSQAEALRMGIARALLKVDIELRGVLKSAGFLKRDPRAKERRKFGLKKARKAPTWSKR
jgi:small subunit ribosomal protein S9